MASLPSHPFSRHPQPAESCVSVGIARWDRDLLIDRPIVRLTA
jgi:hypothetical protein